MGFGQGPKSSFSATVCTLIKAGWTIDFMIEYNYESCISFFLSNYNPLFSLLLSLSLSFLSLFRFFQTLVNPSHS